MPAYNPFQFNSFKTRLITYLVLLLLLVLGTVFISVNTSSYNNTRAVIDDNLTIGREVFNQLLKEREENYKVTFRVLALDFAFREAYNSGDFDTMLSVSENLLLRTDNADMLMVVDYDYLMVADTLLLHPPDSEFPWPYILEDAEDDEDYENTSFILIENIPYQIVAVPIRTPLVDGWIIVGQRLDSEYVESLKEIISSDISIIKLNASGNGQPLATTLREDQAAELALEFNIFSAGETGSGMLNLADEEYVALASPLVNESEIVLTALIQRSLPQALAPYRQLEQRLILLFALGLCLSGVLALFLGRSVSNPVTSLVNRVRKIEQGDYSTGSDSLRSDEIGRLENSVNNMATGLAEKEKVRNLLGKVVSKEIAEELMKGEVKLGGETRVATILFSDIRDFTSLCEGRAPESILEMLNGYLTEVTSAIESNKGVVDKYIGDAVMALFGAPVNSKDDVCNALSAALAMKEKVDQMSESNRLTGQPVMKTGIGLHTGEVVAGNLGSANRMNYTVIGDTVNLASRLEALTKQYGVSIMVSEETKIKGPNFHYRELDMVRVKGKEKPVRIYELLGKQGQVSQVTIDNAARFYEGLLAYRNCQWGKAGAIFQALQDNYPEDKLYSLFLQRVESCRSIHPGENWDGVFTFESK